MFFCTHLYRLVFGVFGLYVWMQIKLDVALSMQDFGWSKYFTHRMALRSGSHLAFHFNSNQLSLSVFSYWHVHILNPEFRTQNSDSTMTINIHSWTHKYIPNYTAHRQSIFFNTAKWNPSGGLIVSIMAWSLNMGSFGKDTTFLAGM